MRNFFFGLIVSLPFVFAVAAHPQVDEAFGELLAWRAKIADAKSSPSDQQRVEGLETLKAQYGIHLWTAMTELLNRDDEPEFSRDLIALGFPLFPDKAISAFGEILKTEENILISQVHGSGGGLVTVQRLVKNSPEFACKIFDNILPDLRASRVHSQSYALVTPMALNCRGGDTYLIERLAGQDSAIDFDMALFFRDQPTPQSAAILSWFATHKPSQFHFFLDRLPGTPLALRRAWMAQPFMATIVDKLKERYDNGDLLASALSWSLESGESQQPRLEMIQTSLSHLDLQNRLSFVLRLFADETEAKYLSESEKMLLLNSVFDAWDSAPPDVREGLADSAELSLLYHFVAHSGQLLASSEIFRHATDSWNADRPAQFLLRLAHLKNDLVAGESDLLSKLLQEESLALRIHAVRWLRDQNFEGDENRQFHEVIVKNFQVIFDQKNPQEWRLRREMVSLFQFHDIYRKVFRRALIDPSVDVRIAAAEKLHQISCAKKSESSSRDEIDYFYLGLRDGLMLPGAVPDAYRNEIEILFASVEAAVEVEGQPTDFVESDATISHQ